MGRRSVSRIDEHRNARRLWRRHPGGTTRGLRTDVNGLKEAVSFGFFGVIGVMILLSLMIYFRFFAHLPAS
jgi:hypothetical protein